VPTGMPRWVKQLQRAAALARRTTINAEPAADVVSGFSRTLVGDALGSVPIFLKHNILIALDSPLAKEGHHARRQVVG
jgi:hypothetical protein